MRAGGSAAKRGSLATLTISARSTSVSACAEAASLSSPGYGFNPGNNRRDTTNYAKSVGRFASGNSPFGLSAISAERIPQSKTP